MMTSIYLREGAIGCSVGESFDDLDLPMGRGYRLKGGPLMTSIYLREGAIGCKGVLR